MFFLHTQINVHSQSSIAHPIRIPHAHNTTTDTIRFDPRQTLVLTEPQPNPGMRKR